MQCGISVQRTRRRLIERRMADSCVLPLSTHTWPWVYPFYHIPATQYPNLPPSYQTHIFPPMILFNAPTPSQKAPLIPHYPSRSTLLLYARHILPRHRIPRRHILLHAHGEATFLFPAERETRSRHAFLEAVFVEFLSVVLVTNVTGKEGLGLLWRGGRTSISWRALVTAASWRIWFMTAVLGSEAEVVEKGLLMLVSMMDVWRRR